ncbi:MAG: GTPase HflX [Armatimonadota bacterium]|nr:GTPase HflX [Armatimonadota bacterium]
MVNETTTTNKVVLVLVEPEEAREAEANAREMRLLVESAGGLVVDEMRVRRDRPDPRFLIGKGQAEEVFLIVQDSNADLVVMSEDLTPTQQRNLEEVTGVRVVDRTQLILDIFAQRARTSEGKLQVELAQLQYLLPRLTGKGTELSRIGGGSAGGIATRGPGETKLEMDRRRVRRRIATVKRELEEVVQRRATQKRSRRELMIPTGALVGYTSAGKSTLLNLLAGSDVEAHPRLFATLDPTTRRITLEQGQSVLLTDTVGFLRNLPHHLIAAFRATLEEVTEADFLIHVVDASHEFFERQREAVAEVLRELGADDKPTITVFNKCDLITNQYELRRLVAQTPDSCYISALTGEGKEHLLKLIGQVLGRMSRQVNALIPYSRGDILALCHKCGRVLQLEYTPEGIFVRAEVPPELEPKLAEFEQTLRPDTEVGLSSAR